MTRLDYYDITPKGMDAYMASHGRHFSKPMLEWAVSMMRDRRGNKVQPMDSKQVDEKLRANGVELQRTSGYYDAAFVWSMAMADYFGSSIVDEQHLAKFVKDYIDDPDGSETRPFDEFYVKTIALGIDIPWGDMI